MAGNAGGGLRNFPSTQMPDKQVPSPGKRRLAKMTPMGSHKNLNSLVDANLNQQLGFNKTQSDYSIFNKDLHSVVNKFGGATTSQKQVHNILNRIEEDIARKMNLDKDKVRYEQTRRSNLHVIDSYKKAFNARQNPQQKQVKFSLAKINKVLDAQISKRRDNIEEESFYHVF